jgi:hypothetical protein
VGDVSFQVIPVDPERAGLELIHSHEARHTFASLMIAAGVNAKGAVERTWATRPSRSRMTATAI